MFTVENICEAVEEELGGLSVCASQTELAKAFVYWMETDVTNGRNIKYLYLYPGAGHTTLWLAMEKHFRDVVVVPWTLPSRASAQFSVYSKEKTYKKLVEDKVLILDVGGLHHLPKQIESYLENGAKCVLVS